LPLTILPLRQPRLHAIILVNVEALQAEEWKARSVFLEEI